MKFIDIFKNRDNIDRKTYLKYMILYYGAPTFFSNKPSTLITFNRFGINLYEIWKLYQKDIHSNLNCKYIELYDNGERCTVLFYNEESLINTTYIKNNMSFLQKYGYKEDMNINGILNFLRSRYQNSCPHEIGIFLGIPLEDVVEFIYGEKNDYLLYGYWKVYHNVDAARKVFSLYDEAKFTALREIYENEK